MTWRRAVLAGSLLFFLVSFPDDLGLIAESLRSPDRRLALGLSLKSLMAVLAIAGLYQDRTYGYAFLLGITLQSLLIRVGALTALGGFWREHLGQLLVPVAEVLFRLNCLAFLVVYRKRLVGGR